MGRSLISRALLLASILLIASGCSGTPSKEVRRISSISEGELHTYLEGVSKLETNFAKAQVTHPKHKPTLLLQGVPTDYVVVLMHGLNESPWYVKGLAKFFHDRGYNVVLPLLAKHWVNPPSEMNKADFTEWIRDYLQVVQEAHKLGRKVILAGHSTGGLLAVHAAVNYPKLADGLLLWSPAVGLSYKTYYAAFVGWLSTGFTELDYNYLAGKPPVDPEHVSYYSPLAGREVYRLGLYFEMEFVNHNGFFKRKYYTTRASAYAAIKVPTFLVMPKIDAVVHRPEVDLLRSSVSGPISFLELPGEMHNSTPKDEGDYYAPVQRANKDFSGMTKKLGEFLDEHFKPSN